MSMNRLRLVDLCRPVPGDGVTIVSEEAMVICVPLGYSLDGLQMGPMCTCMYQRVESAESANCTVGIRSFVHVYFNSQHWYFLSHV